MKSRLLARRERAAVARLMGGTLHAMAAANAAEDDTLSGLIDRVLGATVVAGASTVVVLWNGAGLTLGHVLVVGAGIAAGVGLWWRRRERVRRTS